MFCPKYHYFSALKVERAAGCAHIQRQLYSLIIISMYLDSLFMAQGAPCFVPGYGVPLMTVS